MLVYLTESHSLSVSVSQVAALLREARALREKLATTAAKKRRQQACYHSISSIV